MVQICPNCNAQNPDNMRFCGSCGRELRTESFQPMNVMMRSCNSCGKPIEINATFCKYCGYNYRISFGMRNRKLAISGGILVIIGGALGIIGVLFNILWASSYYWYYGSNHYLVLLDLINLIIFSIAIIGGVSAITGRFWVFSLIGAIFVTVAALMLIIAWFAGGVFLGIPALYFGIPGLAFIVVSRDSFKN